MTVTWTSGTLESIKEAQQRTHQLRQLTDTFLPRTVASSGGHEDWPLVGWAMLARACRTLESVAALIAERRATDAGVLTRSLYEQSVTFAWIAIDPVPNALGWVRWDRTQRKKAHNDLLAHHGRALLDPKTLEDFEKLIASGTTMPPNLAERAEAADSHWANQDSAFKNPNTNFRGLYSIVYRIDSQATHAAVSSLAPLIASVAPGQFEVSVAEADPGEHSPFTRAPFLYGLMLLVAEHALTLDAIESKLDRIFAT